MFSSNHPKSFGPPDPAVRRIPYQKFRTQFRTQLLTGDAGEDYVQAVLGKHPSLIRLARKWRRSISANGASAAAASPWSTGGDPQET
jgi:hypothetical protein